MRKWIIPLICIAAFAAQACGPKLQAVNEYATTTLKVLPGLEAAASDFPESCERSFSMYDPERLKSLSSYTHTDCEEHRQNSFKLKTLVKLLTEYHQALATLSAGDPFTAGKELNALQNKVESATDSAGNPLFKTEQVQAVSGLTRILLEFAASIVQRSTVNTFIKQSYPYVQTLLQGMNSLVLETYLTVLDAEMEASETDFLKPIREKMKGLKDGSAEKISILHLAKVQAKAANQPLYDKKAAVVALQDSLKSALKALSKLHTKLDTIDSKEVISAVLVYKEQLKPALKQIDKAF